MNVLRNGSEGEEEVSPDKRVYLHFMMKNQVRKRWNNWRMPFVPCRKTPSKDITLLSPHFDSTDHVPKS